MIFKMADMKSNYVVLFPRIIAVLFAVSVVNVLCGGLSRRQIGIEFNPGCNITACKSSTNGSFPNLAHISAVGKKDSLHYIVSSIGQPTILVTRIMDKLKYLKIDWEKLLSANATDVKNSLHFNPSPVYSYSVIFNQLIEYNDTKDDSTLAKAKASTTKFYHFRDFQWSSAEKESNVTGKMIRLKTQLGPSNFTGNGSLSFTVRFYDESGREDMLPHLLYNENMTMMDFSIDDMVPSYSRSRYALEMMMITSDKPDEKMTLDITKTLDDEYTPGVFKLVDWRSHADQWGGYMQWKPVCYKEKLRSMADSTFAREYNLQNIQAIPDRSVANAYYGQNLTDRKVLMKASNISFGLGGDGFYTGTNYTSWSVSIGYGTPSEETLSVLVIAIIGAGLGIPVLIIIMGGIIVYIKKRKARGIKSPEGYSPINA